MAIDGWSDKYKKIHYFGVSIHYITSQDGELVLNDRTLMIREMDAEVKDGDYVKQKINEFLAEFDLLAHVDKITFVTDRGGNMVSSLRHNSRVHCFAHLINNTVGKMLHELECVKAATAIVGYFKKSGQNTLFGTSLKSNVTTRWNSVFYMLDSILKHWTDICSILRAKKVHLDDLAKLDFDELEMLRDFLKKFKDASTELEGSYYPTLHLVNPWYEALLLHMSTSVRDSNLITRLKRIGLTYWKGTVSPYVTHLHDIATFLHPMMKGLKAHSVQRRAATIEKVSSMLTDFDDATTTYRRTNVGASVTSSVMSHFVDNDLDSEANELDEYMELKVRSMTTLLQWWNDKRSVFPNLYKIARYIHSIPASSASAERIFSSAGKLCSSRPKLSSDRMDEILFLRSNFDLLSETTRKEQLEAASIDQSDGYASDTEND